MVGLWLYAPPFCPQDFFAGTNYADYADYGTNYADAGTDARG